MKLLYKDGITVQVESQYEEARLKRLGYQEVEPGTPARQKNSGAHKEKTADKAAEKAGE